ncbi:GNAT family N-acetyltransferase [Teredinibacter haidensis]|uniref:GNAT family N-acetyltransferase n=1 Tax=Teredinibacter haidensis TaxID=2731755 RepID=UPI000948CE39|nr:GNAT family N-acetyltransferase [Teredinibacter haidensis]
MLKLRPLYRNDLHAVIRMIDSHDEDDAEAAEADYEDSGFDDQFVLEVDEKVVGVTGFRRVPATENTAWLSWTYVNAEQCGKGYGKAIMTDLLDKLRSENTRKVFVKVSNYEDPEDGKIYERALKLYQSLGFELEVTNIDFYDKGEDQLILGKTIEPIDAEFSGEVAGEGVQDEKAVIRFNGLYEIAESEGAYTFSWLVKEKKGLFGKRSFSVEDLLLGLRSVKGEGGRKVFITFPSNLPLIHQPLQAAGFKYVGSLSNYYEPGVDEMHFSHDLSNI